MDRTTLKTILKWAAIAVAGVGLAFAILDYRTVKTQNTIMWSYLTTELGKTAEGNTIDRSGMLNAIIREYVQKMTAKTPEIAKDAPDEVVNGGPAKSPAPTTKKD